MNTHSPLPWRAVSHKPHVNITHSIQNGNSDIANVLATGNQEADAALIACAPELLQWLKKAVQMARQQYEGGDDAPLSSAWGWLSENASNVIQRTIV